MKEIIVAVVENNLHEAELLSRSIRAVFCPNENEVLTVKCFLDPKEALAFIAGYDCKALFTGIDLCGMDGLILAKKARAVRPQTAIVLTTSCDEHVLQALQMNIPLHGYLSLPTSLNTVGALMGELFPKTESKIS